MSNENLESLRDEIDSVDRRMIDLLSERLEIVDKILDYKEEQGMEIRDKSREQDIIEKLRTMAKEKGLDPELAEDIMRLIISRSAGFEEEEAGKPSMWGRIKEIFSSNPAQLKVARILYKYGLSVNENEDVVCGDIRVPAVQIAKEADVDRRAISSTARTILENEELREIFANLRPIPYLKSVAQQAGLGVIEILPTDASQQGIISEVTNVISNHGLSIRQSIAEDPFFTAQAKLTIITEELISGDVIEELRDLPSVESVIVY